MFCSLPTQNGVCTGHWSWLEAPHVLLVVIRQREERRYTRQPSLTLNPDHTHAGRRITHIISFVCIAILLKDRGGFMGFSPFSVS